MSRVVPILLRFYVLLAFAFIFLPIATLIIFSFDADRFPSLPWKGFSLDWYRALLADATIGDAFLNSIVLGLCVAAVSTVLGLTAAYFDQRWRFKGKTAYMIVATVPPTIPLLVLGLSMAIFLGRIGLGASLFGVFASHVVICTPFALAVVRMRLSEMDPTLEEAAWNLGASEWRALRVVILPFVFPALAAAMLITMAVSFDEFIMAWFVSGVNVTLPVKILTFLEGQVSPRINAIGTIVFCISFTLVALAQAIVLVTGRRR